MNNGFTVLLIVLGTAVSGRAYAEDVTPGRPGVVEVAIIPGGTLFTNGKGTGAAEFGDLTPIIGAVQEARPVRNGPSAEARLTALSSRLTCSPSPYARTFPRWGRR